MASMDVWDEFQQQMITTPRSGFNPCVFWNESTASLAASGTLTGTTRDASATSGVNGTFGSFNAFARADQAGTVRIEGSNNKTLWYAVTADVAMAANTPVILTVPVMTRYHRVVVVNGATPQTSFFCNSGYTAS